MTLEGNDGFVHCFLMKILSIDNDIPSPFYYKEGFHDIQMEWIKRGPDRQNKVAVTYSTNHFLWHIESVPHCFPRSPWLKPGCDRY